MKLTADVVHGFSASVLASRYDEPKPIPPVHNEFWELCCSSWPKVAIAAPRSHAKSTAITFAYVLAGVCFREFSHVLILSANEDLASAFVNDIRVELQENELLNEMFPVAGFEKESEKEIIVRFKDGHKFRIIAKGAGQRMRGLKWERKRPDLVIGDDLEDDEIVLNKSRRDKFKNWFYGAVLPIVSSTGRVRVVGTIVHMDSLLENLMPKIKEPGTVVESLRTYSTSKDRTWKAIKYRAHSPGFEEILWPEQFSKHRLENIRKDFAERGILDIYGQEYLNDPVDESTAYFKEEDFLEMPENWKEIPRTHYAAVDFAISQTEKSDYTVIAIVSTDSTGRLCVEDVRRGRWDSEQIIEEMMVVQRRYSPEIFVAESGAIEKSLGPFLNHMMRKTGVYINLHKMTPTKDKLTRAQSIRARMRAGSVYFDKDASWFPDLHEEMKRFPKAAHDDQVDAIAWIGLALDEIVEAPSWEDIEEEEYQRDYEDSFTMGANPVTGY